MIDDIVVSRFLKDLETLVNIDSGQDSPEGIKAVGDFFAARFQAMGFRTSFVDVGAVAPAFCAFNCDGDHYDYFFTGHMDTVFVKGTAKERPFSIDGNRAKGPGVCDMKHGLLSILHVLENLNMPDFCRNRIAICFQPDEEIGSPYSRELMKSIASKASISIVLEAAEDEDGKEIHCIQRKGMIGFAFKFTGKAGHAGFMLTNGSISAITEMAYWINGIMSLVSRERNTTANIGKVSGGTARNVVAQDAEMVGEIRFEFESEADRAKEMITKLYEHARQTGVKIERTVDRFEPPMVPTKQTEAYVEYLKGMAEEEGFDFEIRKRGGLSAANFISTVTPICIDGMGPAGNGAHGVSEYLCLDTLKRNLSLLERILKERKFC